MRPTDTPAVPMSEAYAEPRMPPVSALVLLALVAVLIASTLLATLAPLPARHPAPPPCGTVQHVGPF